MVFVVLEFNFCYPADFVAAIQHYNVSASFAPYSVAVVLVGCLMRPSTLFFNVVMHDVVYE